MNRIASFARIKCFIFLLLLMIADILPVPILGVICMYILLARPPWFKKMVEDIYAVDSNKAEHD
ncbi:MAG: hypothetical protein PHG00_05110 [Methylococcales bacterium]|nr:hypothetical protein [Methylococcales bacterium]